MLCVAIREIFGSDIFINFIVRKITWNSENGLIWKVFKPKKVFRNKFILYYYKKITFHVKKKTEENKNLQQKYSSDKNNNFHKGVYTKYEFCITCSYR